MRQDSRRLRRLLRGNVGALAIVSFFNDAASEMIYPLLPAFLVGTLGAGPALLGMVEGLAESASSLLKYAGGWASDRLRARKMLVIAGYGLAGVARPFLALATAPWHVLAVRLADRAGKGVRTAPRDALLADSAPAGERGLAFGLHRAADHAGSVVGPTLAALLLLAWPGRLRLVFAFAAVPAIATLWILARRVREVLPQPLSLQGSGSPDAPNPAEALAGSLAGPAGPSDPRALAGPFRLYLAVVVLFTLGNASDAFLLLRAQELGVSMGALPALWAVFHVSKMTWSIPGGRVADRIKPARVVITGWLVYAGVYAGFAMATGKAAAWALFVAYGLFFGLTEAPEKVLVAHLSPPDHRARTYGAFHGAVGMAALPASVLFGVLWQSFGSPTAFLTGAALAGLAAACLMRLSRFLPDKLT
jgi:MFS family permease